MNKRTRVGMMLGAILATSGINLDDMIDETIGKVKTKPAQSEEEKTLKLEKATARRNRRANKKALELKRLRGE